MKIIIDEKQVKRNGIIGKILRWVSLGCMALGLFAVFSEQISSNPQLFATFFIVMILGVLLSSISGFFTNRFGGSPRPDELIDKAFKGLDDRFQIYHYRSSIPHLLLTPAGIWSIMPIFIDGEIVFDEKKNNWFHKKNSFLSRMLQREYFPNLISEYKNQSRDFEKIKSKASLDQDLELNILVIMMHKNAKLSGQTEKDKIQILLQDKVKDKFRKLSKSNDANSVDNYSDLKKVLDLK